MKRIVGFVFIVVFFIYTESFAQIGGKEVVDKYFTSIIRGSSMKPEIGVPTSLVLSTSSFPITFSRLDKDDNGDYRLGASFTFGYAYVWIIGNGTLLNSGDILINPEFSIGITANFGFTEKTDNSPGLENSFVLGGVLGIGGLGATIGYDFITESPIIGICQRIDLIQIKKNSYHIWRFHK